MTWRVLPHMARAFQTFRKEPAPSLACTTCHGKDAEAVAYQMPHGLPALDPAHLPDPKSSEIARFMIETVTPDMAEILGEPVFDPLRSKASPASAVPRSAGERLATRDAIARRGGPGARGGDRRRALAPIARCPSRS